MSKECLLLFWMLCPHISLVLTNEPIHFGRRIKTSSDDIGVDFYAFEWKIKVSKKECMDACRFTEICEYINFEVRSHLCALVKVKDDREGRLPVIEKKPGYVYMDKSEWIMEKKPMAQKKCDTSTQFGRNVEQCENTGCGYPMNGDFNGNMFSTGSRVLLKCGMQKISSLVEFDFLRLTCTENGTWTNPFKCQPYFNGSYYYIQLASMPWYDAKSICESMSGHLIDINSSEEQKFILKSIQDANVKAWGFWLGGNDLETENTFRWSDGSSVSLVENWLGGNPDNYLSIEHCMELNPLRRGWNDAPCHSLRSSICEFP